MTKRFIYNQPAFKERRKELRKSETKAEHVLWQLFRNKQFFGLKFFRQYSVGPYVLDFYCSKMRLAIELDGGQHADINQKEYDKERTAYLKDKDIHVLRFWNNDVLKNREAVLEKIEKFIPPLNIRGG